MSGDPQEHIPPFVGLSGGWIATNCHICKGLEEVREFRLSEYVKAVRLRISRSVRNSRPIGMPKWSVRRANWKSTGACASGRLKAR